MQHATMPFQSALLHKSIPTAQPFRHAASPSLPRCCLHHSMCRAASEHQDCSITRRVAGQLLSAAALGIAFVSPLPASALPASKGQTPDVGTYLPPAGVDDFVEFIVTEGKTPAIRAGSINITEPYRFALPPSWKEGKVANIQSGNFCQPRCDEPWTEVVFESTSDGKVTLIVAPLRRLGINKSGTPLEQVGTPESILGSIGSFITGTSLDPDEDLVAVNKRSNNGRTYYIYETYAPAGTNPPHSVTAVTAKADLAYLLITAASDKQWGKSSGKLHKIAESFRA